MKIKSLKEYMRLDKKGQTIDLATGTVIALVLMIFTVFAVLFGISALNPASFFTAGSASGNATLALQDNTTRVVSNFSQQLPTVGTILGVVLILAALAILILVVTRFRSGAGGSGTL